MGLGLKFDERLNLVRLRLGIKSYMCESGFCQYRESRSRDSIHRGLQFEERILRTVGLHDAYIVLMLASDLGVNSVWAKA